MLLQVKGRSDCPVVYLHIPISQKLDFKNFSMFGFTERFLFAFIEW